MHLLEALPKSAVIAILIVSIAACSAPSSKVTPAVPTSDFAAADYEKAVAEVNGKAITVAELKRAKRIMLANKPGLQIPPLLQKEFETQALNQLISSELLFQASQKLGVSDLDAQARDRVALVKKGFADQKAFEQELQKIGMDEKMLLASTRRDLAIAYLVDTAILPKVKVSGDEVTKFYKENPDKFQLPEQVRASHILIGVEAKAGAEERKEARQKAEKLRQQLAQGGDFATLARENSTCPSGREGGDLGFFAKGKMVPQFEQAAFALQPGGVSDVVETQFGYHIIKMVEKKQPENVSLEAARAKIEDYLKTQKKVAAIEEYVLAARKEAKVVVLQQ
jgi:peptidyl-prolyl cis-trans isomerase C